VARVRHWPLGLPQYGSGHKRLVDVLQTTSDRQPGLFLANNYFTGPSVAVCLTVAQKTALAAHKFLEGGGFVKNSISLRIAINRTNCQTGAVNLT